MEDLRSTSKLPRAETQSKSSLRDRIPRVVVQPDQGCYMYRDKEDAIGPPDLILCLLGLHRRLAHIEDRPLGDGGNAEGVATGPPEGRCL